MGLQDYVYRLKAQAGDTTPHDETGTSGALSGGTITLVDRGSGDYAWEFSGGPASVAIPSDTLQNTTAGGGYTIAMRVRVSNYGSLDNAYFVGVGASAPSSATDMGGGSALGRLGANVLRARYKNETGTLNWTQNTTEVTVVLVMEMNYSGGNDRLTAYYGATSASSPAATASSATIDTVWVQALNSAVVQVADLVVWYEELSAADCQALRDSGINATLDAGGGATASGATLTTTASLIAGSASGDGNATAGGVTLTATASLIAGSASASGSDTANGVMLTATLSLIAGSASGVINGVLNFQAAGMEFGARTGLGIDTFALENGKDYRYTVHADGLTLGAAILTSATITLDSNGKLPNLVTASLTPGTDYRVVAIRQSDGEAATFRMTAS